MPFVEILAPPADASARAAATRAVTEGLCRAFSVGPETVTLFFLDVPAASYAHAGDAGPGGAAQRVLVKVHAFRRGAGERRAAAAALTPGLAEAYGVPAEAMAVYFLDRERDEVSHAGVLASDKAGG